MIATSREVFDSIRRSLDIETSEFHGRPGFTTVIGRYSDRELAVLCIPPYPQAIVDAVRELYLFGVRRVIFIGEGLRVKGEFDALLAVAAVSREFVSRQLVPLGSPLYASPVLFYSMIDVEALKNEKIEIDSGLTMALGITFSVDSFGNEDILKRVESESKKLAGYIAIDCCTAALYAIRHGYALETLSVVITPTEISKARTLLERDEADRISEMIRERAIKIFPILFERVARGGEEGLQG